jgi:hypothetical protein
MLEIVMLSVANQPSTFSIDMLYGVLLTALILRFIVLSFIYAECYNGAVMLSVTNKPNIFNVIMLSVILLSVDILRVTTVIVSVTINLLPRVSQISPICSALLC